MPDVLSAVSNVLPLSYAIDAMREVQTAAQPVVWGYAAIIAGFAVGMLAFGAATLRRRTP
jgi:ABC-2 type transport system permease protein